MQNKYRIDQLFVYLNENNTNAEYKICSNHSIPPSKQLIPLCSLFLSRTTDEMNKIYKFKLTLNEISIIEKALNDLNAENLYVAPVKVENDKPETMPLLLTWDGTGRDSPRRPYFQQYLSDPYVDYDGKHFIKLSNLFDIKSQKITPLQVMFLNQIIASPKFNKRFEAYLSKIVEEEKKIEAVKASIENANRQIETTITDDFEKLMLW